MTLCRSFWGDTGSFLLAFHLAGRPEEYMQVKKAPAAALAGPSQQVSCCILCLAWATCVMSPAGRGKKRSGMNHVVEALKSQTLLP